MKAMLRRLSSAFQKAATPRRGARFLVFGILAEAASRLQVSAAVLLHAKAAAFIAALAPYLGLPLIGKALQILAAAAAPLLELAAGTFAAGTLVSLAGKVLIAAGLAITVLSLIRLTAGFAARPLPTTA